MVATKINWTKVKRVPIAYEKMGHCMSFQLHTTVWFNTSKEVSKSFFIKISKTYLTMASRAKT